jgi:hypothetical protein
VAVPSVRNVFERVSYACRVPQSRLNKWFIFNIFDSRVWIGILSTIVFGVLSIWLMVVAKGKHIRGIDALCFSVWFCFSTLIGENISSGFKGRGNKYNT